MMETFIRFIIVIQIRDIHTYLWKRIYTHVFSYTVYMRENGIHEYIHIHTEHMNIMQLFFFWLYDIFAAFSWRLQNVRCFYVRTWE